MSAGDIGAEMDRNSAVRALERLAAGVEFAQWNRFGPLEIPPEAFTFGARPWWGPFVRPQDPVPVYPLNPRVAPGPGWTWFARPGVRPGEGPGTWIGPKGEKLFPDFEHGPGIKPHWDYMPPKGTPGADPKGYRWFQDGTMLPKSLEIVA